MSTIQDGFLLSQENFEVLNYLDEEATISLCTNLLDKTEVIVRKVVPQSLSKFETIIDYRDLSILNPLDYYTAKSLQRQNLYFLVSESYDCGSIDDVILKSIELQIDIPAEVILSWIKKIIKGLQYIHSKGFIHSLINSETIYLTTYDNLKKNNLKFNFELPKEKETTEEMKELMEKGMPWNLETCEPKIGNFEKMIEIGDQIIKQNTFDDSMLSFLAPEVESKKPLDESIDIWSLGIVIYQLYKKIPSGDVPKISSIITQDPDFFIPTDSQENKSKSKIEQLIYSCLQIDTSDRPTCEELINFIDNESATSLKSYASSSSLLTFKVDDVLASIKSERGRKFWKESGWKDKPQVEWMDFLDKYYESTSWKKISKNTVRGLKKILCERGTIIVTYQTFDDAISNLGFPFDMNVVAGMEESFRYSFEINSSNQVDAKEQYLNLIKKTSVFLDPISQVSMSLVDHYIPLNIAFENEFEKISLPQDGLKTLLSSTKGSRISLTGSSSCGKTFLLKMILQKQVENEDLVPIYVPLKILSNSDEIKFKCKVDFPKLIINASANSIMNKNFRYSEAIEEHLLKAFQEKKVFLLFDGLDECNEDTREYLIELISNLSTSHLDNSVFILTSRMLNYSEHSQQYSSNFEDEDSFNKLKYKRLLGVLEFKNANLLPLNVNQQVEMTRKAGLHSPQFDNILLGKKYYEFSKIPLFLSFMICYFREHQSMPEQKSKLFQNVIEMIINVYFQKKGGNPSPNEIIQEKKSIIDFLTKIAVYMHQNRLREFSFKDVSQFGLVFENIWESYFDNIKGGLFPLLVPDVNSLSFYHPAFQDYLVSTNWSSTSSQLRSQNNFKKNSNSTKLTNFIDIVLDPWYRNTILLMPDIMNREDHRDFCKWLFKSSVSSPYKYALLTIIMQFIELRPTTGKDGEFRNKLLKMIASQKQNLYVFEGLVSESEVLRKRAAQDLNVNDTDQKNSVYNFILKNIENGYICVESLERIAENPNNSFKEILISKLDLCTKNNDFKNMALLIIALGYSVPKYYQPILSDVLKFQNVQSAMVKIGFLKVLARIITPGNLSAIDIVLNVCKNTFDQIDDFQAEFEFELVSTLGEISFKTSNENVILTLLYFVQHGLDISIQKKAIESLGKVISTTPSKSVLFELNECFKDFKFWTLIPEFNHFYDKSLIAFPKSKIEIGKEIDHILSFFDQENEIYKLESCKILLKIIDFKNMKQVLKVILALQNALIDSNEFFRVQILKNLYRLYLHLLENKKTNLEFIEHLKKRIIDHFIISIIDHSDLVSLQATNLLSKITQRGDKNIIEILEQMTNEDTEFCTTRALTYIADIDYLIYLNGKCSKNDNLSFLCYEGIRERIV
eukprot:gene8234-59_t